MPPSASTRLSAAILAGVASATLALAPATAGRGAVVPKMGPCTRSEGLAICLIDDQDPDKPALAADEVTTDDQDREMRLRPVVVVGEDGVASAVAGVDPDAGQPMVLVRFNEKGRRLFAAFTRANVGRRTAILIDGVVVSAPIIQMPIVGGAAQITGNFTAESARAAADRINAIRPSTRL